MKTIASDINQCWKYITQNITYIFFYLLVLEKNKQQNPNENPLLQTNLSLTGQRPARNISVDRKPLSSAMTTHVNRWRGLIGVPSVTNIFMTNLPTETIIETIFQSKLICLYQQDLKWCSAIDKLYNLFFHENQIVNFNMYYAAFFFISNYKFWKYAWL